MCRKKFDLFIIQSPKHVPTATHKLFVNHTSESKDLVFL